MGESDEPFPFFQFVKDKLIHVFTRKFANLALSELDTVSDFCEYLREKEAIDQKKRVVVEGGEENLLAKYLELGHNFSWMNDYDNILIDGTVWPTFSRHPQFLAKKEEDKVSYGWDSVIDRAHDGTSEHCVLSAGLRNRKILSGIR